MLVFDPSAALRAALRILRPSADSAPSTAAPVSPPPGAAPVLSSLRPQPGPAAAPTSPMQRPLPSPSNVGIDPVATLQRTARLPTSSGVSTMAPAAQPPAATPHAPLSRPLPPLPASATPLLLPTTRGEAFLLAPTPPAATGAHGAAKAPTAPSLLPLPLAAMPQPDTASTSSELASAKLPSAPAQLAGASAFSASASMPLPQPIADTPAPMTSAEPAASQVRADVRPHVPTHVLLPDPEFLRPPAARVRRTESRRRNAHSDEAAWWEGAFDPERESSSQDPEPLPLSDEDQREDLATADDTAAGSIFDKTSAKALSVAVRRALQEQAGLAMRAQANVFAAQARDLLR